MRGQVMKRTAVALLLCVIVSMLFSGAAKAAGAADDMRENRRRIIFVVDDSKSMLSNDPEEYRYSAIRRFMSILAVRGNFVGSVNFADDCRNQQPMEEAGDLAVNDRLTAGMSKGADGIYTNIGAGLLEAVEMLEKDKANADLQGVVILLTDGKTKMKGREAKEASLELEAEAIDRARERGYKIYTICLNTENERFEASPEECRQIAEATGALTGEVSEAKDLKDIYDRFQADIFNTVTDSSDEGEDIVVGDDGTVVKTLTIPEAGVEEANFILDGEVESVKITGPDGTVYTGQDPKSILIQDPTFAIVKILEPVGGDYDVEVHGQPGVKIRLKVVYNMNFFIKTSIEPEKPDYKQGETVKVRTVVFGSGNKPISEEGYKDYAGKLKITANGKDTEAEMKTDAGGMYYDVTLENRGLYTVSGIVVECSDMTCVDSESYSINVENQAPVSNNLELKGHANVWPIIGGGCEISLDGAATDPEGDPITYEVVSSAYGEGDYSLDGNVLKVSHFSIPKGSFDIAAVDSYGASCTVTASVTSTNIGIIMAIATAVGILIAIIVVILGIRAALATPFMGILTVMEYTGNSDLFGGAKSNSFNPGRGRCKLERFRIDRFGFPKGTYIQAGGKKKCVYFVSKQKFLSTATAGASGNIQIFGDGRNVTIYLDEKREKGIIVSFRSNLVKATNASPFG